MRKNGGQIVWEKYRTCWNGRTVARSGVDLSGATLHTEGLRLPINTPEHDLEHEAMVTFLTQMVLMFHPDILSDELKLRLLLLCLVHDVVENRSGDHQDNATIDPVAKKDYESGEMEKFVLGLPNKDATQLLHDFLMLEDVKIWEPTETKQESPVRRMIQMAFMADKFAAIFTTLCLEQAGHPGDMRRELATTPGSISDRDLFYIGLTGSTLISDVWSACTIDCVKWFIDFPIFFNIWKEAYLEVKKTDQLPKWSNQLLKNKYERLYQPFET